MSSSRKINNNNTSSSSDEKKMKRMISNRESAKRSRMRKEQHIKDLNDQVAYFRTKGNEMLRKTTEIGPRYMAIESENRMLRMQGEELKMRLELLQEMLVSCNKKSSYIVFDDDHVANNNNNNNNIDHNHEFNVMDMMILQEPWLQHSFDQYSQAVDGI